MAMRPRLKFTKTVRAKGHVYVYFNTGKRNEHGKVIYASLPHPKDKAFGATYAAMLGQRMRRETVRPTLTVKKLVDLYQASEHHRKLAPASQRIYEIYQRKFVEMLETAPAGLIERQDIILLLDKRAKNPGAANALLSAIAAVFRWGRQRGHVTNEPCKDIDYMEMGEHDPWPDHILAAALKSDDDRVRLGTHLLYYTAQRISDVLAMRWSDIVDGTLYVKQRKTGIALEIPVHRDLAAELAKNPKRGLTIMAGIRTKPLHHATLRKALQDFAHALGTDVVPHGLRKNAVIALLEAGCSVAQVAAISGQTLQTIEHYAKRRSQIKLSSSAILLWEANKS